MCEQMAQVCFFPEYNIDHICDSCFMNTIVNYKNFIEKRSMKVCPETFEAYTGWQRSPSFNEEYFTRRLRNLCINIL